MVRPETLINQHYDEEWLPLLQTPPFPEYTSGHSVISRAAAKALTNLYGDNFKFIDTTEVAYGLLKKVAVVENTDCYFKALWWYTLQNGCREGVCRRKG